MSEGIMTPNNPMRLVEGKSADDKIIVSVAGSNAHPDPELFVSSNQIRNHTLTANSSGTIQTWTFESPVDVIKFFWEVAQYAQKRGIEK